jgi:hypothetical protein
MGEVLLTDEPAEGLNVVVLVCHGEETFHELVIVLYSPCRWQTNKHAVSVLCCQSGLSYSDE